MADVSDMLAQFPLELVVFPGEDLPLHIFEPRYRDLIQDCVHNNSPFGITPVLNGKLQRVGTVMQLVRISKEYDDGRLDILTRGIETYAVKTFYEKTKGTLYAMASVEMLKEIGDLDSLKQEKIQKLVDEMFALMRIPKKSGFELSDDPFTLGHKIGLTLEEEYELLCIQEMEERQAFMLQKLARVLPKVKELDQIRRQIEMNGHFRHIIPPKL